ncbi:hypothetical protein [Ereboglobus luteus]|uniref:hypothetical protein n=1 Tax=Ereboglobus luteus TaxID=1796921 RepID=UPI00137500B7|nr:hypothetical protein [Ereboglobus luteus]
MKKSLLVLIALIVIPFGGCAYSSSGGAGMSGYPNEKKKAQKSFEKDLDKSVPREKKS